MIRPISETAALVKLTRLTDQLRSEVFRGYEHKAQSCSTCATPGACCLDAHFVNVHLSRLESVRIGRALRRLTTDRRERVRQRVDEAIARYRLSESGDTFAQTFA